MRTKELLKDTVLFNGLLTDSVLCRLEGKASGIFVSLTSLGIHFVAFAIRNGTALGRKSVINRRAQSRARD